MQLKAKYQRNSPTMLIQPQIWHGMLLKHFVFSFSYIRTCIRTKYQLRYTNYQLTYELTIKLCLTTSGPLPNLWSKWNRTGCSRALVYNCTKPGRYYINGEDDIEEASEGEARKNDAWKMFLFYLFCLTILSQISIVSNQYFFLSPIEHSNKT